MSSLSRSAFSPHPVSRHSPEPVGRRAVALAASVLLHFLVTMARMRWGSVSARYIRWVHLSLFAHMVAIVLLAKGMFYFGS